MLKKETVDEPIIITEKEMLQKKEELFLEIQTIIKLNQMSNNFQN